LIFWNSFAAVELFDALLDLRVDCFAVFKKPTILLFLGLQQTQQHFLDAAGGGSPKLFTYSGLNGRITDLDVYGGPSPDRTLLAW
jgi:hypothetical protein